MRTALATIVSNIGRWLNAKLRIIETDPEKNLYYDWADQSLDGLTSLSFEEWKESRDCRPGSG